MEGPVGCQGGQGGNFRLILEGVTLCASFLLEMLLCDGRVHLNDCLEIASFRNNLSKSERGKDEDEGKLHF